MLCDEYDTNIVSASNKILDMNAHDDDGETDCDFITAHFSVFVFFFDILNGGLSASFVI